MRVINVLDGLPIGGIEMTLLRCLPYFRDSGVHVDICTTGGPLILRERFEYFGCRFFSVGKSPIPSVAARRFGRVILESGADVVHSRFGATSGGYVLAAARAGVPSVVSFHSSGASLLRWEGRPVLGRLREAWLALHKRIILERSSAIVGHSAANLNSFWSEWRGSPACLVVYNGFEFDSLKKSRPLARVEVGLPAECPVLLHVGSFRPQKNHRGLIQIFKLVVQELDRATLVLVGDGPLRPAIERQVKDEGLEGRVVFVGAVPDPSAYYAAADLLVFPSVVEGFGNVLVECQGMGTPVVASEIPPHLESLAPSFRDLVFPVHQVAMGAELALEVLRDSDSPAIRKRIEEAQRYVRHKFGIERMAKELAEVYRKVLMSMA